MSKKLYNCMECHPTTCCIVIADKEPESPLYKENCKPIWYYIGEASVKLKPSTKKEILEKRDKNVNKT